MKTVFNEFYSLVKSDPFAKNYSVAIGIAIVVDWLMMPMFTKLMGLYAPIILISVFYIVSELSGYIEHIFHNSKFTTIFILLIISDIVQVLAMSLFFFNEIWFTYALMCVFSCQALLYEIYSIKAIQFMELTKTVPVSKFQSLLLFNKSNMVLLGLIIGGVYSLLFNDFSLLVALAICISSVSIVFEFKLLNYIKKFSK